MQAAILATKQQDEIPATLRWLEKHTAIKLRKLERPDERTALVDLLRQTLRESESHIFYVASYGFSAFHDVEVPTSIKQQLGKMLFVAPLQELEDKSARLELMELVRGTDAALPLTFLTVCEGASLSTDAIQALSHCTHLARSEPLISSDKSVLRRLLEARKLNAEKELIASASIEGEWLVVWSCEPKRYDVPLADLPDVVRLSTSARRKLKVEAGGSFIHWPAGNIDIGMEQIRELTNPTVRRAHAEKRRQDARQLASTIAVFRRERGLSQKKLEELTGLSERTIRRLEDGDTIPHSSTLQKLAAAHGLDLNGYLGELAKRRTAPAAQRSRARARKRAD